nr:TonB-dependent receptor [Novosphingobium sp.]
MAFLSSAASAQDAKVDCAANPNDVACADEPAIVVTGSILRQVNNQTVSPVTNVTAENLDQRGLSTVQDGLQQLAANNGPALTNSFSANGAFAAGASAVSLRGLSTNSTLVLFDGMRAAYYPLADDGSRNFVDLNTVPDDIVDRIEVLRDGASSSYGADAIAGVVNIITKREVKGLFVRGDAGISSRGDAGQYRLSATVGKGDLDDDGYNAYLSGFYYKSNKLMNRDRPYPFNTDDLRQVCGPDGTCAGDNRLNAPSGGIFPSTAANLLVRPYNATNTAAQGRYQNLGGNCSQLGLEAYNLTAANLAANTAAPAQVCVTDFTNRYGTISPAIERYGLSGRVTAKLGDAIEAYAEVNFLQSKVSYNGFPATIRGTANTGIYFPQFSTSTSAGAVAPGSFVLTLPIYVCPNGQPDPSGLNTGCTAANGTLNPNNPFAAQGQVARLIGRIQDQPTFNQTRTRAYRGALGVKGNINDDITFDVGATAMHVDLQRTQSGYFYINNILTAIARGTFNLVNPLANTEAQNDYVRPDNITPATSDQVQFQAVLGSKLAELPGGPLQIGVGGSIRYEAVDAPSANSDINGPTQRYFTLNAFGTSGSRWIQSAFAELDAPILPQVDINLSGRYDHYSSGQSAFSPKAGVKLRPIDSLLIRGTYSRGFRIPSFGEANALPTTGFVSNTSAVFTDAFLSQYGCTKATFSTCPVYIRSGSYGQTTLASPNLQPEKSRSFTAGIFFEPIRNLSFSVDYYNIKKTGVITQPSNAPALAAYYGNNAIPAGYTVVPDAPDVSFPNARPRVAFVQSQLVNANTQKVSGLDFAIDGKVRLSENITWASHLEAGYILKLETEFPDGTIERYDGTLGNFNLTAGSGTPKWKGYWLNSLTFGDKFTLNGTVNYYGGYDLSAQDQGTGYKDCGLDDGTSPTGCGIPRYITFDLQAAVKVNDQFTFSLTMLNVADKMPPIDVVTYGAHLYNPVQGGNGILGRYLKAGFKMTY